MPWQETGDHGIWDVQFTAAMLAVYIAVFGAEYTHANLGMLEAFPWRISHGETWRLLTCTVLHGGIIHILFNALWFFRFSSAIERWLGPWITLGLYIFFAAGASAAQFLWSALPAVGASGAVYGLFGFLWVTRRRYDIAAEVTPPSTIQIMLGWLVICAVLNLFGSNIANVAHLFGLLFGWLAGQVVVARKGQRIPIILGSAALWLGLLAMTYAPVWDRTVAHLPVLNQNSGWMHIPEDKWPRLESHPINLSTL